MSSDELRVNSIDRFAKPSDRLVLEEYSHCEVPAGCGGVVLRWRNPDEGRPVAFITAMGARLGEFAIDGRPVAGNRTSLREGPHVLAVELQDIADNPAAIGLYTILDAPDDRGEDRHLAEPRTGTGEWRFVTTNPGDGWTAADFVDDHWSVLATTDLDTEAIPQEAGRWRFSNIQDRGRAEFLELPVTESVWVRHRFTMEAG